MNLAFAVPLLIVAAALGCFAFAVREALMLGRDMGRRDWFIAIGLAGAAFVARSAIAIGTYVLLPYGRFAPDELGYSATGLALSRHPLNLTHALSTQGWFYFNAAAQQVFGDDHLLPRLWNAAVGSVAVLLVYVLATKIVGPVGARFTALVVALMPSLVLWSSLNLKDTDVWALILAGFLLTLQLQIGWRWQTLVALVMVVCLLGLLRQYAAVSLALAAGVGVLATVLRPRLTWRIGAAVVAAVLLVLTLIGERLYAAVGFANLATMRHDFAIGARSAVDADPGLKTLHGALAFLPRGLIDLLIRPFPWEVPSVPVQAAIFDLLAYYVVLTAAIVGLYYAVRARPMPSVPLLVFIALLSVGYGLVLGNLGTSYRERAQIVIVLSVFAGAAFQALWVGIGRDWLRSRQLASPHPGVTGPR